MSGDAFRERLARFWGPLAAVTRSESGVDIVVAEPTEHRFWRSFATIGLSDTALAIPPELAGRVPERIELATYGGVGETWPARLLEELTDYAVAAPLTPYQAVAMGGPVDGGDSTLTGALLLPPYFEPDELAVWDERGAGLLWAAPVTTAELEWAVMAGGRALEDVLFEADLRPDPDRQRGSLV